MMPAISAGELGNTSNTCQTFSPARSNEQNRIEQPMPHLLVFSHLFITDWFTNQTFFVRIRGVPILMRCQVYFYMKTVLILFLNMACHFLFTSKTLFFTGIDAYWNGFIFIFL